MGRWNCLPERTRTCSKAGVGSSKPWTDSCYSWMNHFPWTVCFCSSFRYGLLHYLIPPLDEKRNILLDKECFGRSGTFSLEKIMWLFRKEKRISPQHIWSCFRHSLTRKHYEIIALGAVFKVNSQTWVLTVLSKASRQVRKTVEELVCTRRGIYSPKALSSLRDFDPNSAA